MIEIHYFIYLSAYNNNTILHALSYPLTGQVVKDGFDMLYSGSIDVPLLNIQPVPKSDS